MTKSSNANFSTDVPISPFLQLDVVGLANVWEYADSVFPSCCLKAARGRIAREKAGLFFTGPVFWSLTIDAQSKIVLIPFTLFPCSCV